MLSGKELVAHFRHGDSLLSDAPSDDQSSFGFSSHRGALPRASTPPKSPVSSSDSDVEIDDDYRSNDASSNEGAQTEGGHPKLNVPTGSELEKQQIDEARQALFEKISGRRIRRLIDLMQAEYFPDSKQIILEKTVGVIYRNMGYHDTGKCYLYPEEALFLMDCGLLELRCNDCPLSLPWAMNLLLGNGDVTFQDYQVYAYFSRAGWIVLRHSERMDPAHRFKILENQSLMLKHSNNISESVSNQACTSSAPIEAMGDSKLKRASAASVPSPACDVVEGVDIKRCKLALTPPKKDDPLPDLSTSESAAGVATVKSAGQSHCDEISKIWPKEIVRDSATLALQSKPSRWDLASLFGSASDLIKSTETFSALQSRMTHSSRWWKDRENFFKPKSCEILEALNRQTFKVADNWQSYKQLMDSYFLPRESSASVYFDRPDNTPLCSGNTDSLEEIRRKLQIIKPYDESVKLAQEQNDATASTIADPAASAATAFKYSFDLYASDGVSFRASQPGKPDVRVCVVSDKGPVPTASDLLKLNEKYKDSVRTIFAVVSGASISFLNIEVTDLPNLDPF